MKNNLGILYIVATPIGNLQDMSLRAIDTLKAVQWIAVEDTRHSQFLLQHFGITTKTLALHEHNERDRASLLLDYLQKGDSIALISDAGTPLISDPGYFLVREARRLGVRVVPVPGACAAIAALCVAGLATDRFVFEGFLPAKTVAKRSRLALLQSECRTLIFYESPHRLLDTLQVMETIFGQSRQIVLARELTKIFETIHTDTLINIIQWVKEDKNQQRGEIVLLVEGVQKESNVSEEETLRTLTILVESLPLKQAVELAVKLTGGRKNVLYEQALAIHQAKK